MHRTDFHHLNRKTEILMDRAIAITENAYAPYSGFRVGAAALLANGEIFTGANMENASYGLTVCAEVALLSAINSAGKLKLIDAIAIASHNTRIINDNDRGDSDGVVYPCGRCRQLMMEVVQGRGGDIDVYCLSFDRKSVIQTDVHELLPMAFFATM